MLSGSGAAGGAVVSGAGDGAIGSVGDGVVSGAGVMGSGTVESGAVAGRDCSFLKVSISFHLSSDESISVIFVLSAKEIELHPAVL